MERRIYIIKRCLLVTSLCSAAIYIVWAKGRSAENTSHLVRRSLSKSERLPHYLSDIRYEVLCRPNFVMCNSNSTEADLVLFIAVLSHSNSFFNRQAIRQTWANSNYSAAIRSKTAIIFFVVGIVNDESVTTKIVAENDRYDDILLTSIAEDYTNLTLKVFTAIELKRSYCSRAEFLMKTDDDVIVDIDRVMRATSKMQSISTIYGGNLMIGSSPYRRPNSKWFVSKEQFASNYYPSYTSGLAYVIPREALEAMYSHLMNTTWLPIEDVFFTGVIAHKARLKRAELENFAIFYRPKCNVPSEWPCDSEGVSQLAVINGYKAADEVLKYWSDLQNVKCGRKPFYLEKTVWKGLTNLLGFSCYAQFEAPSIVNSCSCIAATSSRSPVK